jgi:serine phosphatase RsbU (regulator of sigma subunit)
VSLCAVPLDVKGRTLGALRFSFNEPRLFDDDERRFVLTLAAQTAQALDRSQLQQHQVEASTRLQRSLLPPSVPAMPGIDAAAVYQPFGDGIEVGGDFYDLWQLSDGAYGFAIGDVAGTGPEAAAVTALVRYSLRALTFRSSDMADALVALNDLLLSAATADADGESFFTAVLGTITPRSTTVELTLVSGGHPLPMVRRADGRIEEVPLGGSLLGTLPTIDVAVAYLTLHAGDLVVLFTDGLLEARGQTEEMFGTEGVARILGDADATATATATVEALKAAVLDHVGGELADDMAALVLRVDGVNA